MKNMIIQTIDEDFSITCDDIEVCYNRNEYEINIFKNDIWIISIETKDNFEWVELLKYNLKYYGINVKFNLNEREDDINNLINWATINGYDVIFTLEGFYLMGEEDELEQEQAEILYRKNFNFENYNYRN